MDDFEDGTTLLKQNSNTLGHTFPELSMSSRMASQHSELGKPSDIYRAVGDLGVRN